MSHQDRQIRMLHDIAGRPAEYHLPQPGAGEGSLDQEVAALSSNGIEDCLSGVAILQFNRSRLRCNVIVPQLLDDLIGRRSWYRLAANDG